MRDQQVTTFLHQWSGFSRGVISSDKPCECVPLSEVLQENVTPRFSLSPKAASGILRRAERRGKTLPAHLEAALEAVAGATT